MRGALYRYVLPNIMAMLGMSCYILADTFFISRAAGADGLTALNLVMPVYSTMFAVGSLIGIGSASRYAILQAAGDRRVQRCFTNALLWIAMGALPFVMLGTLAPGAVLHLLGADAVIYAVGLRYLQVVMCFAPAFMWNYAVTGFVRNDGAPRLAMCATLLSSGFNIVFDYIFMFSMGMGMFGAGLATAISPVVSIAFCLPHYLSRKANVHPVRMLPDVRLLLSSCMLGLSALIGEVANAATVVVFNFVLLALGGNIAVAAYGVVANVAIVLVAIFNGVAQGLQPLAGEAAGRGDEKKKKAILRESLLLGCIMSAVIVAGLWLFAAPVTAVFNSEHSAQLAELATRGLRLYSLGFLFAAVNLICAGFFSAVGRARESFVISCSRGIAAIIAFALILPQLLGMTGVWLAFPAAEAVTFLLSLHYRRCI